MISHLEDPESQTAEILMEAQRANLNRVLKQCPTKIFSKTTIFMLIIQLIKRVQVLHNIGYIHNDIKLENILVSGQDPSKILLIDFGLSQKYLNPDGSHIKKKQLEKFSGNFLFASFNSCRGCNKSRRDDLQSIMLLMVYLLNNNKLPWSDFNQRF